jgi:hypothetical protein
MIDQATGTTGNPVQDGITRAGWVGAVQAAVAFTVLRWEWLTAEELALLEIPIVFVAVGLWGVYDRYLRPRCISFGLALVLSLVTSTTCPAFM